ncbi:MAG: hypothetical protein JNM70_16825 [Anaerolineae bacterium]|nr:hypothetical protein [Anaerolineae bacterium]
MSSNTPYSSGPPYAPPPRSGCLIAWLGVSAVVSVLSAYALLAVAGTASRLGVDWIVWVGVTVAVVQLVCLYGIFNRKRWGVYGIVALAFGGMIIQIIGGIATIRDYVSPFIQLGVLYWVVRDQWDYFD